MKCIVVIFKRYDNINIEWIKNRGFFVSSFHLENAINLNYEETYLRFDLSKKFIGFGSSSYLEQSKLDYNFIIDELIVFKENKISISAERFLT